MPFPARTWTTGELVTASIMNGVRDELNQAAARAIAFGIGDVAGPVITTGLKGYLEVPFACTITGWTILADAVGSIVVDVYKDSYASFPPTIADTITGTEKPTLVAAQKNQNLSLASWATALALGDVLGFNVDSVSGIKLASIVLRVTLA